MDYLFTFLNGILVYLSLNSIVKVFDVSPETMEMATQIMHMYILSVVCLYPSAMAMAYGLRGAGDTKFVMTVSIVSMFTLRIGAAYLFVNVFDCGIMGIWYAQPLDWILRSTMFWGRFIKGKWRNVKVI